ncbi:hypothetical protein [Formosa sp. A9]|uniref:hypothetical protein n=1 Tax=Formosa sp. A9 TaxID=3442641 RepID=UPI003EBDF0C7
MKKLLFIVCLLTTFISKSQSLTTIFKEYVRPHSTTEDLRTGLKEIEQWCATNPEPKCTKAKASALYFLSDRYYQAAYQVYIVDQTLADPILQKAQALFSQANNLLPIDSYSESDKHMLLESKQQFDAHLKYAVN